MGNLLTSKTRLHREQDRLRRECDESKQEQNRLRRELVATQKQFDELKSKTNTLPDDLKVRPIEGWPEGFVQKDITFQIPPKTETLYARAYSQCVGVRPQTQRKFHVQLLNDPDPERKWQLGKSQFKMELEWLHWQQYTSDHREFKMDCEIIKFDVYTLEITATTNEFTSTNIGKMCVNEFVKKYLTPAVVETQ